MYVQGVQNNGPLGDAMLPIVFFKFCESSLGKSSKKSMEF